MALSKNIVCGNCLEPLSDYVPIDIHLQSVGDSESLTCSLCGCVLGDATLFVEIEDELLDVAIKKQREDSNDDTE